MKWLWNRLLALACPLGLEAPPACLPSHQRNAPLGGLAMAKEASAGMIYLYFKGQANYPGEGCGDLRRLFHDRDQALQALNEPLEEHEWNELIEIDPESLKWSVIVKEN